MSRDWYANPEYETKARFISYWHQINEVLILHPSHVLEIGIGSGFVSNYLRDKGIHVTTVDINPRLRPDMVATIMNLPFKTAEFDVVTAYEILEHLPYGDALNALKELHRVSQEHVILSLPDATRYFRIELPIPKIGKWRRLYSIAVRKPPEQKKDHSEHMWEIGKKDYPQARLMSDLIQTGFRIKRTYRIFEHPRHRFFQLEKMNVQPAGVPAERPKVSLN